MDNFTNHPNHNQDANKMEQTDQVAVIIVPLPAQGHLNQLLQLSCLISSYGIPVYYVASAIHNRQARVRINGLNPLDVAKINFHNIPTAPFASPPPDPNSCSKFPSHLQPSFYATFSMRKPFAVYLQDMANKFRRVVVVHDSMMSVVVQDVASIHNAESYALNCISAFCLASFVWERLGKPFPGVEHLRGFPSEKCVPYDIQYFTALQYNALKHRAGDIYNTCRLMEAPYLDILESEENASNRKSWAIGPILPAKPPSSANKPESQHKCFKWLDKQAPKSVIYITFGTTTTLTDEEIKELALGLEQSKVKFLWVLRDADRGNVFDGEVRKAELPQGFEERVEGVGMVVRDWAPQPEILAHPSTGGYMSHCGWNSCIESITTGVPVAAWPMHSDQPINAVLITEILKTGLPVRQWNQSEELVEASTIESVVRRLMASEEGEEMRRRAEELAATVQKATQHGGGSQLELDSFIAHITR